jgi:hypothetical protein
MKNIHPISKDYILASGSITNISKGGMTANDKLKFAQSNSVSVIEEVAGAYN